MEYDPLIINNTMTNPDTVTAAWDKCNLNFADIYADLVSLESELGDVEEIDGGLVE
jgi:hypothetical protein